MLSEIKFLGATTSNVTFNQEESLFILTNFTTEDRNISRDFCGNPQILNPQSDCSEFLNVGEVK